MTGFVLSPKAQEDLEAIWDYTVESWSTEQAEAYMLELKSTLERISANPAIGRSCQEIRKSYRKLPAGSHVIYYRIIRDTVDVVRILHQRMEVGRHL